MENNRIYFKTKDSNIVIINDDFLTTSLIPEESVDLIVTSPPYNVDIHYESFKDNIPYEKYLEFTEKWLEKALTLVKPDGRMCLNIPLDKSKGRKEEGFQSVYAGCGNYSQKSWMEIFLYNNMERAKHFTKNGMGLLVKCFSPLCNSTS